MARIRTVKPEFWSSPDVGDVSRDARLTFIGLWNEADDTGRLEAVPAQIRSTLFPYDDDVTIEQVCGWLNELARQGLVRLYAAGRRAYLHITGWADHQKISNPSNPRCPDPDDCRQIDSITPTIQRDLARVSSDDTPSTLGTPSADPIETLDRPSTPDRRTVGPSERRNVGEHRDADASPPADDQFDDFWARYPRGKAGKRGGDGSRKAARQKWRRMTKKDRAAALAAVDNYRAHVESPDGPYAAHATTWLNQERWEQWQQPAAPPGDPPRTGVQRRCRQCHELYTPEFIGGAPRLHDCEPARTA